jgi:hypothetical protein
MPYGSNRNNVAAKENRWMDCKAVAEAVDTADNTRINSAEVYLICENAAADSPSLTVNIKTGTNFNDWKCTWDNEATLATGTATKQAS